MTASKARIRANDKYKKKAYYRPSINLRREYEDALRKRAESEGKSVSTYIQDLIKKDLGLTE